MELAVQSTQWEADIPIRFLKFVAVVSFLAIAFPVPSKAQVAISGTYYEETLISTCTSGTACFVRFSSYTRDIIFTKVNCAFETTSPIYLVEFAVADTNTTLVVRRPEILPVPTPVAQGSNSWYSVLAPSNFLISATHFPTVVFYTNTTSSFSFFCKITGTIQ